MKHALSALVCLVVAVLVGAGCGSDDSERVEGTGYSFELPEGWKDRSDTEEAQDVQFVGLSPDTVVTGERTGAFTTNVNVIRQDGIPPGTSVLEVARASVRVLQNPRLLGPEAARQIGDFRVRDVSALERTRLDGEPAVNYSYTATRGGRLLRLRQVIAVNGDSAYTVTFTARRERFRRLVPQLDSILSSWNWD